MFRPVPARSGRLQVPTAQDGDLYCTVTGDGQVHVTAGTRTTKTCAFLGSHASYED